MSYSCSSTSSEQARRAGNPRVSTINAGLRAYSEKYFLPEIRDELDGAVSRGETDAFMETLRQFHQSEFTEAELSSFVKNSNVGSDILRSHFEGTLQVQCYWKSICFTAGAEALQFLLSKSWLFIQ